jgi:hypothetical protein
MLQCSRSKEYKAKGAGQKVYATRMTGCPWRAKLTPSVGNGWKVTTMCQEHNHPLDDELNDRGVPPRARMTPAKPVRALAAAPERSHTPPGEPQFPLNTFLPALSAWPTVTASGIKVSQQLRVPTLVVDKL